MGINERDTESGSMTAESLRDQRYAVSSAFVRGAFDQALQGQRMVVSLPPGFGKTYGTLQAIKTSLRPLKVLWFMPETHDASLAEITQQQLQQLGIDAVKLYRLTERPTSARQRLLTWPDHTQVKLLAHAYLPLLFGHSRPSSLLSLLEADVVIVDENPLSQLLTLSGTPGDRLPNGRSAALPLDVYLENLSVAGLLRVAALEAHEVLTQGLLAGERLQDDRQREITFLTDEALVKLFQPLLSPGSPETFAKGLMGFWQRTNHSRPSTREARQVRTVTKRLGDAAARNLQVLQEGGSAHGVALVRFPDDETVYVRNATLESLDFGSLGVLYLDAFPHLSVLSVWLPDARVLPLPKVLNIPKVQVEALVPEHPHDILTINRKAVFYAESHARHHAMIQRALKLLGPRVVILAHRRFAQLFQGELGRDFAPHTTEVQILYWKASTGLNAYAGWDAFIVNESRIPRRVLYLDLNAVATRLEERQAIYAHLEAADFLQLLHRTRPLTHAGRILVAYDPADHYHSPLIAQQISVTPVSLPVLRGKSEHVLALELARTVVVEALQIWPAVPMRLLHLLFALHPDRPAEPWDEALQCFLTRMRVKHKSFDWLDLKPNPRDRQDRGLSKLLGEDLGLVAYSVPVRGHGRGRPHAMKVWSPVAGEEATGVYNAVRTAITIWFERQRSG